MASSEGKAATALITAVPQRLTGTWAGSGGDADRTLAVNVALTEAANGDLSGSGTIGLLGMAPDDFTVISGNRSSLSVVLSIQVPTFVPFVLTATYVPNDAMSGELNGSGFSGFPLSFTRTTPMSAAAAAHDPRASVTFVARTATHADDFFDHLFPNPTAAR